MQENVELVSLAQTSAGGVTDFGLQARSGAVFATIASFPTAVTALPWGDGWINLDSQMQLVLDAGVLSSRQHVLSLPTAPLPIGLVVVVQSATLDSNLTISNAVGLLGN